MTEMKIRTKVFPTAEEDRAAATRLPDTLQTRSASYGLAYADEEFMLRDELRPVRLQLELLKPELLQQEQGIHSTIVIFGSTRIPDAVTASELLTAAEARLLEQPTNHALQRQVRIAQSIVIKTHYYESARKLAQMITSQTQQHEKCDLVVITGGGPGIMEAANRGAYEAGGKTIGLNIVLPKEQCPNPYITPELCFQFHYFAIRKMHFLMRAKALIAFPGGFGTLDELFETLTLVQTKKIKPLPILLFGKEYWQRIINFDALVEEGMIAIEDLALFTYVESFEDAWLIVKRYYDL